MLAYLRVSEEPIPLQAQELREDLASRANVHVWRLNLTADQKTGCTAENLHLLSVQEQIRADEFRRQEPRINYIKTRGALRCLLGMYLQQHPADVQIEGVGLVKPFLASPADAWLCFNVAHSGAQALVAIGRERSVGVDIERVREDLDHSAIIQDYFAAEEQAELAQLPSLDRLWAFFHCWTRKEAYLKATGRGLSMPLDSFVVSARPGASSLLLKVGGDPIAAASWTLRDVPVAPGYAATVAAEGEILELRCLDYAAETSEVIEHVPDVGHFVRAACLSSFRACCVMSD
jgi:4'-phosphopantetheinyl transferase